jgi:hypothetical protein
MSKGVEHCFKLKREYEKLGCLYNMSIVTLISKYVNKSTENIFLRHFQSAFACTDYWHNMCAREVAAVERRFVSGISTWGQRFRKKVITFR